jgi:alkanesulfonate monooxygenase SsuD/methylene tetrahydromethanopterin reductase-like flavin-dependent oxidoreductase (luciferase family)
MEKGVFLFGGVELDDAGPGIPSPMDRRQTNKHMWHATERMIDMGVAAERYGYDSYWLTEHHFQHEGYEVVPNGLMIGAVLAERTERIKIGAMFNIVGQWHPLRFAEDFATMHNLSRGRGVMGVGRGTVPREAQALGTAVGSFDNPDQQAADSENRLRFEEAMQVIRLALDNETFSFHGDYFTFPPPGLPDRGGFVEHFTLVPRPLYPYEIYQAITSPPSLEAVPTAGYGGVMWLKNYKFMKHFWDRYAEVHDGVHGGRLGSGDKRIFVVCTCVEDTYEEAVAAVRPGHDEFWKFLGPYGWSKGYAGPDGKPAAAGLIPSLEDSLENKTWLIGSPNDVIDGLNFYKDLLGYDKVVVFPGMPGDSYDRVDQQMARLAEEVLPYI